MEISNPFNTGLANVGAFSIASDNITTTLAYPNYAINVSNIGGLTHNPTQSGDSLYSIPGAYETTMAQIFISIVGTASVAARVECQISINQGALTLSDQRDVVLGLNGVSFCFGAVAEMGAPVFPGPITDISAQFEMSVGTMSAVSNRFVLMAHNATIPGV